MDEDLAVLKACADGTRLRLLHLLAQREMCVCELVAVLDMPQGKVSRHLAVLKRAGLVQDRREGTWMHYSLSPPSSSLMRLLGDYLADATPAQARADRQRLQGLIVNGAICRSAEAEAAAP